MFKDDFINTLNKFNFTVTLPMMLFRDISAVAIREVFDLKYVLFCAGTSTICFWGIWGLAKIFIKDKQIIGAFVQGAFRSSAAVLGLAFIESIYGRSAMGPLMIIGAVPLYNIFSVIVLTVEGEADGIKGAAKIKQALTNILKNPILIAIVMGLLAALVDLQLPVIINSSINKVAQMATPLALVALGAGFEGKKALAKIKPTLVAALAKLMIQPAIFLPLAAMMGFTGEKMIGILIMLAAPTTPSCYIMAKSMKNDGILTASIVVVTTLLGAFTLTFWIYILKRVGLIG